jgi:hypothetical protein
MEECLVNDKLERIWKGRIMVYLRDKFEILLQGLRNYEKPVSIVGG